MQLLTIFPAQLFHQTQIMSYSLVISESTHVRDVRRCGSRLANRTHAGQGREFTPSQVNIHTINHFTTHILYTQFRYFGTRMAVNLLVLSVVCSTWLILLRRSRKCSYRIDSRSSFVSTVILISSKSTLTRIRRCPHTCNFCWIQRRGYIGFWRVVFTT